MAVDFSKLSDEDLKAIQAGRMDLVSDDGLRVIAGDAAPPPAAPESNRFANFLGGINERFMNLAGAGQPGSLSASPALSASPMLRDNILAMQDQLRGPAPQTETDEAWRSGGGVAADALLFAAAPQAAALRFPQVLQRVSPAGGLLGTIKGAGREAVAATARAPVRSLAVDTAAAAGAGAGLGLAREARSNQENDLADFAAATSGGLIGASAVPALGALASTAVKASSVLPSRFVLDALSKGPREAWANRQSAFDEIARPAAERRAASMFSEAVQGSGGERQQQALDAMGILGINPRQSGALTIAESTADPELLRIQQNLQNRASGDMLRQVVNNRAAQQNALEQGASSLAPAVPETSLGDVVGQRLRGEVADLDASLTRVTADQENLAAGVPRTDLADVGSNIRETLAAAKRTEKGRMRQLAEDYGLNENVRFSMDDLVGKVDEAFVSSTEFGRRSPGLRGKLKAYFDRQSKPDEGAPVLLGADGAPIKGAGNSASLSLQDLQGIRSEIGDDIGTVLASNDPAKNRNLAELMKLREAVDDYIATGTPSQMRPELNENWAQFRQIYRQYADTFERGPVYQALARRYRGADGLKTLDEQVAKQFLSPTGARQYVAAGGDVSHIEAALMDSLNQRAIRNGVFQRAPFETWLKNNEQTLRAYNLYDKFSGRFRASEALTERAGQLTARRAEIERSALYKALDTESVDPGSLVNRAIQDPRVMRDLLRAAKSAGPEAEAAVPAEIWQAVISQNVSNPQELRKLLQAPSLKLALKPQHIKDIEAIATFGERVNLTTVARGDQTPATFDGALREKLGTGIMQMIQRVYTMQQGFRGANYAKFDIALRFLSKNYMNAQDKLMFQALRDPKVAHDILLSMRMAETKPREALSRLRPYLFAAGMQLEETEESGPRN